MSSTHNLPELKGHSDPEPNPDRPNSLEYGRIIAFSLAFASIMVVWILRYSSLTVVLNASLTIFLVIISIIPHERLHYRIATNLGYNAETRSLSLYPNNIIRKQEISVEDYVKILLAPIKYMTIPLLLLILVSYLLPAEILPIIQFSGIFIILFLAHLAGCADDLYQWWYLSSYYDRDDTVYMVDDTKETMGISFETFQTGYYKRYKK